MTMYRDRRSGARLRVGMAPEEGRYDAESVIQRAAEKEMLRLNHLAMVAEDKYDQALREGADRSTTDRLYAEYVAATERADAHVKAELARLKARRNGPDDTLKSFPEESLYTHRVIVLTMHRKRGPVEVVVLCDRQEEAIEVSRVERGKQTNQRANAIVRIDSRRHGEWHPLVQWTYVGSWRREMQ